MRLEIERKYNSEAMVPRREDIKLEVLRLFRVIFKTAQQHAHCVETICGISNAQLWALSEISQNPGMRVTELAEALSVHQTTASNLLDKLCKTGLIRRERINEDQRVVSLFITDSGQQMLANSPRPTQGILQSALFNLPDSTLTSLESNLNELILIMDAKYFDAKMQPIDLELGI